MKRLLLVFAAAGLLLATPACKKGENDPFLSLKGRKARLAGEYTIASWFSTMSGSDSDDYDESVTIDIEDGKGTVTSYYEYPGIDPVNTIRDIVITADEFIVDKNGTWSRIINLTTTWSEDGDGFIMDRIDYTRVSTLEESGTWSFLGGQAEEFKNKERVLLSVLDSKDSDQTTSEYNFTDGSTSSDPGTLYTYTYEYPEGGNSIIYEIDMLKNKEMTFIQDQSMSDNYVSNYDGDIYAYSMTQTGETKMTFVQN